MSQIITIEEKTQGQRLDKFLAEVLTGQTRSQIKKMIQTGAVLVNSKSAKVHHFLKTGDKISIGHGQESATSTSRLTHNKSDVDVAPIKIIFETTDFLVLDKPSGLLVHPVTPEKTFALRSEDNKTDEDHQLIPKKVNVSFGMRSNGVHPTIKNETNTLAGWLIKKYPQIAAVGEQSNRQGIIHRLDKDVSGVMVTAKTNEAYFHLKHQFKDRLVKKEYIALVYGRMENNEGEIDLPIGRNKEGQFVAHPRQGKDKFQSGDKLAKTKYKVLEYIKDYTLLSVQILTGRTHQIRAHLSAVGHPILGDGIYKPKNKIFHFLRRRIKVVSLDRIFLHSTKIGFNNLNNEWVEFSSPLPQELKDFLDAQTK